MKNNRQTLLHMSLISGIGPATVFKIINRIVKEKVDVFRERIDLLDTLCLDDLYRYKQKDFQALGLSEKQSNLLYSGLACKKKLEEELELIEKYAIRTDTILDVSYPFLLRHIHQPPLILYTKGVLFDNAAKRMAFVGSRKADQYAHNVISRLVEPLVGNGWEIVSGGAAGADSMAHQATIDTSGKTIVVFGAGLLCPYPAKNKQLFRDVFKKGGTLVSAFPLRTPPDRKTFPARNRIIAGLSHGCVIVQAAEKSGALITAHYALEQGRQVFAVPGSVFNQLSAGCHSLLAQGAKLVEEVQDILDEYGEQSSYLHNVSIEERGTIQQEVIQEKVKHVDLSPVATRAKGEGCSEKEEADLSEEALAKTDPFLALFQGSHTIDELSVKSGLSLAELQDKLFCLSLEGKVKQNFAGSWERC